jgi:hypothetical protein
VLLSPVSPAFRSYCTGALATRQVSTKTQQHYFNLFFAV